MALLSLTIEGREAIPVRAIPLVTSWNLSPDEVATKVADLDEWGRSFRKINAYHSPDSPTKFKPAEWDKFVVKLGALSARLKRQESEGMTWVECRVQWLDESIKQLPGGAFVWRDEFEAVYQKHIAETLLQEPLQEDKRELNLSPYCTDDSFRVVMAGFESYATKLYEKTFDESPLSFEDDQKALVERITRKLSAESVSEQAASAEPRQAELDNAPSTGLTDFRRMDRLSWNEIQIDFVAGESGSVLLNVSARQKARRIALAELDLINRKNGEMNHQGAVLLALALRNRLPNSREMPRRVSRLRDVLKKHFGIDSDPFDPYNQQAGYKPVFKVSDKRNSADERARKNAERKTISWDDWQAHKSQSEDSDYDSNDDEETRFYKEHPELLEDDDLSR